jgi:hypothetical protein
MQTLDFRARDNPQDAALIRLRDRELELRILYCVGDEAGPLAGEISLGISSRRALGGALETAQRWRSEKLIVHFQHVIRGEGALLRLKAALESNWRPGWKRGSWWEKDANAAKLEVVALAAEERIPLLTDAEADELEAKKLQEVFTRIAGV